MLMNKYQTLIEKIQNWKKDRFIIYATYNFTPTEIELIQEALETMQFLEIFFKVRKERTENKN